MTISEAKNELRQYRQTCTYLEKKREDIDYLRARLTSATSRITGTPGGHNPKAFEAAAVTLADAEQEHSAMYAEAERKRLEVERKINRLDQPYRNVLYLRYMRCKRWAEISRELGYDENYISRDKYQNRSATGIHGAALRLYAEL